MKVGIIGGSGLYDIEGIEGVKQEKVKTPYGSPSAEYNCGVLHGVEVYFLPRHGQGHTIMPSEINYRANICGFKMLGVERIISVTAVGSLKEDMRPRDVVLPDQYFDRTKESAQHTFFGEGIVGHASFGDPVCPSLHKFVVDAAKRVVQNQHKEEPVQIFDKGTYVNMAGPAFSTRAESNYYRSFGFDIIGMTSLAEAKLSREAEICYQTLGMVTDYDCWRESAEPVTAEIVIGNLMANKDMAKSILKELIPALNEERTCGCVSSMAGSIVTDMGSIPDRARERIAPILGKYIS